MLVPCPLGAFSPPAQRKLVFTCCPSSSRGLQGSRDHGQQTVSPAGGTKAWGTHLAGWLWGSVKPDSSMEEAGDQGSAIRGPHSLRSLPKTGWGHLRWTGGKWATSGSHLLDRYGWSSIPGQALSQSRNLTQLPPGGSQCGFRSHTAWLNESPSLPSWARSSPFCKTVVKVMYRRHGDTGRTALLTDYCDKYSRHIGGIQ